MNLVIANFFLAGAILSTVLPITLVVAFSIYWLVYVRRRPSGE